ncbi:ATP-dependent (S)-NAD(P)H-hydrate dehydratase [Nucleospora cyclopteri]
MSVPLNYFLSKYNYEAKKGQNSTILMILNENMLIEKGFLLILSCLRSGTEMIYVMASKEDLVEKYKMISDISSSILSFNEKILKKITCCVLLLGNENNNETEINTIKLILKYLNEKNLPCLISYDFYHYQFSKELPIKNLLTYNFQNQENTINIKFNKNKNVIKTPAFSYKNTNCIFLGILSTAISLNHYINEESINWAYDVAHKAELICKRKEDCAINKENLQKFIIEALYK